MTILHFFLSVIAFLGATFTAIFYKARPPEQEEPVEPPVSPQPAPSVPVEPVEVPKVDKVHLCALAQQQFEGWWPGSNSFTKHNPGNIKGLDGKFLVFTTDEAGMTYLENYIRNVALGKNKNYPIGCTIEQYTHVYTGDPEPAPTNYAAAISRGTGLSTSSLMADLLS